MKRTWFSCSAKIVHSWGLSVLNMQKRLWFVSSFEHVNFETNGRYSKNIYDNPNCYISLVIFQTYKNAVKSVHSLGWLLRLWFYPQVLRMSFTNNKPSQIITLMINKKSQTNPKWKFKLTNVIHVHDVHSKLNLKVIF